MPHTSGLKGQITSYVWTHRFGEMKPNLHRSVFANRLVWMETCESYMLTSYDTDFNPALVEVLPSGHLSYDGFAFIFAGGIGAKPGNLADQTLEWAEKNLKKDGNGRWLAQDAANKATVAIREELLHMLGNPPNVTVSRKPTEAKDVIVVRLTASNAVPMSVRVPQFKGFAVEYEVAPIAQAGKW